MMLSYELAKQLKDAGFPLRELNRTSQTENMLDWPIDGTWYLVPTLNELIDACGENFSSLAKVCTDQSPQRWQACSDTECCVSGEGDTAIIAVARLWLALDHGV
jgi:alpha-D-ribose 1-methylphosphonate 5-phosphate C-P lyase